MTPGQKADKQPRCRELRSSTLAVPSPQMRRRRPTNRITSQDLTPEQKQLSEILRRVCHGPHKLSSPLVKTCT